MLSEEAEGDSYRSREKTHSAARTSAPYNHYQRTKSIPSLQHSRPSTKTSFKRLFFESPGVTLCNFSSSLNISRDFGSSLDIVLPDSVIGNISSGPKKVVESAYKD